MRLDISAEIDVSAFERAARDYAEAGGKTLQYAQWRGIAQWARKAIAHHRGLGLSAQTNARISALFTTRQWRLYSWLAKGRPIGRGKGALTAYAQTVATARKKSVGFPMALLLAMSRAAARRSDVRLAGGTRGWTRLASGGLGRFATVEAGAMYQFRSPLTSARQPRDPSASERAAIADLAATQSAQVADMEVYIARKLEGRP